MIANNIDEVITHLEQIIETSKTEESPLGYFAVLYQRVTIEVKNKLHTDYFADDERMERLDVVFANRYLEAWSNYRNDKPLTAAWEKAFEFAKNQNVTLPMSRRRAKPPAVRLSCVCAI